MNRYVLRKPINIAILIAILAPSVVWAQANERLRTRELGIQVGVFPTGVHNAITDVSGVQVGHSTVVQAPHVRTGVTAILPHAENAYMSRVPAALHVGNGYGKLLGVTQVRELGELETPIPLPAAINSSRAGR